MTIRVLGPADASALEAFLLEYRDSSMFLRANSKRAGLVDNGEIYQATYAGAFHGGRLVGVAAHSWSGNVLVQAPERLEDVVRLCVQTSGRTVLMGMRKRGSSVKFTGEKRARAGEERGQGGEVHR
jgi:hypothetical protein